MDDRTFRSAMGKFATGVTVITTEVNDEPYGMTANAFMSVSVNPKLVLISVDEMAHMNNYVRDAGKFAVSILNEDQQDMSAYFAGQVEEYRSVAFDRFNGMPTIPGSLVNLTCNVHDSVIAGDHTLYIGEVTDISISEGGPLTFFSGKYKQINGSVEVKEV
ncbi:flavin reductase family protein [Virgibacillus siamensis]|uniref:Flavin reductase family protein n=1 Tax=Virgibacillus siamensis TaxID=480071 RepID=A0ABN1FGG1_9BACI